MGLHRAVSILAHGRGIDRVQKHADYHIDRRCGPTGSGLHWDRWVRSKCFWTVESAGETNGVILSSGEVRLRSLSAPAAAPKGVGTTQPLTPPESTARTRIFTVGTIRPEMVAWL